MPGAPMGSVLVGGPALPRVGVAVDQPELMPQGLNFGLPRPAVPGAARGRERVSLARGGLLVGRALVGAGAQLRVAGERRRQRAADRAGRARCGGSRARERRRGRAAEADGRTAPGVDLGPVPQGALAVDVVGAKLLRQGGCHGRAVVGEGEVLRGRVEVLAGHGAGAAARVAADLRAGGRARFIDRDREAARIAPGRVGRGGGRTW